MTQAVAEVHDWLAGLTRPEPSASTGGNGDVRAWLNHRRKEAIDRFLAVGFPSNRQEEWRTTNVSPIARIPFRPAPPTGPETYGRSIDGAAFSFAADAEVELVFLNGHYSPHLSSPGKPGRGVRVGSLAAALAGDGTGDAAKVEAHLSHGADLRKNPFVALNTAFLGEGAYVHLAAGAVVHKPIHLLFLSTPSAQPAVSHPRVLVIADERAEAKLVETYAGVGDGVYFTNAVTELWAGVESRLEHCRVQQESPQAFHISTSQVRLDRSANYLAHNVTLGGALTRNELNVVMAGERAEAMLTGLTILDGRRHADNHTLLDHAAPNCPSHELYKHVLDGQSSGVFKGKILVRQIAQKTDSKQTSKTLLLTDEAAMNSQPALEIYADDVKCTHGSTTGPQDEEQIFYLRQRGVGLEAAKHLLTYAFAADITGRINILPVRRRLETIMAAQHGLPQDLQIQTE